MAATLFNGTLVDVGDVVTILMDSTLDTTVNGLTRIPKGAVSLDAISLIVLQAAGGGEGGNAMVAIDPRPYEEGDAQTAATLIVEPVAVPAPGVGVRFRRLTPLATVLPAISSTDRLLRVSARRDGTDPNDTFANLNFVGAYLAWTTDE